MDFKAAKKHFGKTDPVMFSLFQSALQAREPIVERVPVPEERYFYELAESIASHQLSVKAAATIWGRLVELTGEPTPQNIAAIAHEQLRGVGLSNAKASYIKGLSEMLINGELELSNLDKLEDEVVIERLTGVKGIGRWSAEMFLMFTLARPDVFSVGDLGLTRAVELAYDRPGVSSVELEELSRTWSPHRTTAALVLWHSRDAVQ